MMTVIIDAEKCGNIQDCPGEGLCIKICEPGALVDENNNVKVIDEKCDDCDLCIQNCPNQAITKP